MSFDLTLYLATDPGFLNDRDPVQVIAEAIEHGVTAVQLRDKVSPAGAVFELGERLLKITRPAGVPLIVNDRVDIALALKADGVHVGANDLPLPSVRARAAGLIVGYSVESLEDLRFAEANGADYAGVGPLFPTGTKQDAGPPLGLTKATEIANSATIPCVGIGGINEGTISQLKGSGLAGACVISGILDQDDPGEAADLLRWLWQ